MSKVLLLCLDLVGPSMAGPAIRYWEFAHALSQSHQVVLLTINDCPLKCDHFSIKKLSKKTLLKEMRGALVLISQHISPYTALLAKIYGTKLILDAYDPMPIENLELFKDLSIGKQKARLNRCITGTKFAIDMSHLMLCANKRQKNLWLGFLFSQNKVHPLSYQINPNLTSLIEIVPFGMSAHPPQKTGPGLREKFQLPPAAKVVLWGGGIWNWFDPLTLIRAMHLLRQKRHDIYLVFMGIKHPNPAIPNMKMCQDALDLAKELNLLGDAVHFNFGWIPYEERQNYLLDADIGVSTHLNHLETQFSFRTRILDYLWASLPILTTEGDCFAELVKSHNLGQVVPFENPLALAESIESLLDNPQKQSEIKKNIQKIQQQFHWQRVVEPIEGYIDLVQSRTWSKYFNIALDIIQKQGLMPLLKHVYHKAFS